MSESNWLYNHKNVQDYYLHILFFMLHDGKRVEQRPKEHY